MPFHEYRCLNCGRKVSIFWRSMSAVDDSKAACEHCGSKRLVRLMSKVRVVRGESGSSATDDADNDPMLREMDNLDENDPRALGRFMRKMAAEAGEDMPPEFDEVVGRLEKGESPEAIEQEMGDVLGEGGPDGMMDDDYAPPPDPQQNEDAKLEKADKAATAKRRTVAMKSKPKKTKSRAAKPKRRAKG